MFRIDFNINSLFSNYHLYTLDYFLTFAAQSSIKGALN